MGTVGVIGTGNIGAAMVRVHDVAETVAALGAADTSTQDRPASAGPDDRETTRWP